MGPPPPPPHVISLKPPLFMFYVESYLQVMPLHLFIYCKSCLYTYLFMASHAFTLIYLLQVMPLHIFINCKSCLYTYYLLQVMPLHLFICCKSCLYTYFFIASHAFTLTYLSQVMP